MISFIKEADTKKLHCVIRLDPMFTIYPTVVDLAKYESLHEYAVDLGAKLVYQLCNTLVDQIEEDLKVWKKEYVGEVKNG